MNTSSIFMCDNQATSVCYTFSSGFLDFIDRIASINYFVDTILIFAIFLIIMFLLIKK